MEQAAGQVQRQAIKDMLTDFLVTQGHVPEDLAANGATRVEDLDLDSLDMVEMVYEVEEKYGIRIDDMNQLRGMTIEGLIGFLHALVVKKAAAEGVSQGE